MSPEGTHTQHAFQDALTRGWDALQFLDLDLWRAGLGSTGIANPRVWFSQVFDRVFEASGTSFGIPFGSLLHLYLHLNYTQFRQSIEQEAGILEVLLAQLTRGTRQSLPNLRSLSLGFQCQSIYSTDPNFTSTTVPFLQSRPDWYSVDLSFHPVLHHIQQSALQWCRLTMMALYQRAAQDALDFGVPMELSEAQQPWGSRGNGLFGRFRGARVLRRVEHEVPRAVPGVAGGRGESRMGEYMQREHPEVLRKECSFRG